MAANAPQAGVWDNTPLTKFRIPRVRREVIARPTLLGQLNTAIDSSPVTLVSAPGGYGKTTLLAQWATDFGAADRQHAVWLAIDDEDNDSHRFFASLLRAVEPLALAWEIEPVALLANAAGSASQQRAALAALVNALCTSTAQRIAIVLDDLHRIDATPAMNLLEALIERLPDHVSLILGTRVEPALPLARWRVHGELTEFSPSDLEFGEGEAMALASTRLGAGPSEEAIRDALRRTHGWAAGLSLILQSTASATRSANAGADRDKRDIGNRETADRRLFDYLAQEVLSELPDDLRHFALQCSILAELNPQLCRAVSERDDAGDILNALYRRNLFLTAVDEQTPVLRFHDLFRDFLLRELERRTPNLVPELHRRAGRAEMSTPRAIAHFVAAQSWDEAVAQIEKNGEALLIEGGHATLERWIDQVPDGVRERHATLSYLRGICAWLRWDWPRAKREFAIAIEGMKEPAQASRRLRCMFMYVDALNSSGEAAGAAAILDDIARQPLSDVAHAQLALQRGWHAVMKGDPELAGRHHDEFIADVDNNPGRVAPATADLIHCLCVGLPRVVDSFERYYDLTLQAHPHSKSPWKFSALTVGLWSHFWRGRKADVQRLLQEGETMHRQFGTIRLVAERLVQFRALYFGAIGQHAAALAITKGIIDWLHTPEASGHRASWLRGYLHGLARQYWITLNAEEYLALLPQLVGPRRPTEWPFIDAATETARGHAAIFRKDFDGAITALQTAVGLHERFRMPSVYADPRVALAYAYLQKGDKSHAWQSFKSAYDEVVDEHAVGLLLLEPAMVVDALLANAPSETRRTEQFAALRTTIDSWRVTAADALTVTGPLAALSDREREVLAQVAAGAGNKHIARDLSLSLHTVKRHIANILDKLDCASRGQAADLFRKHAG